MAHVPFLASGVRISLPYLSFIFFKAGWNNQDFLTHHITSLFAFLLVIMKKRLAPRKIESRRIQNEVSMRAEGFELSVV
jgi:hypothetical protein